MFASKASTAPSKALLKAFGRKGKPKVATEACLEQWTLAPSRSLPDFDILKVLSHGRKGTVVYLARDKYSSRLVALKVIAKIQPKTVGEFRDGQAQYEDLVVEQRIHGALSLPENPYFVPLLCSWHDSQNFYLAMEYMQGGDLAIELGRCGHFEEDRARLYAAELIVAVEELRKKGVVHRDIKPANILFTPEGHVRLADFGLSAQYNVRPEVEDLNSPACWLSFEVDESCESGRFALPVQTPVWTSTDRCGTVHYMAPEQLQGLPYGIEVDAWSIAGVMYCMLVGEMPFGSGFTESCMIGRCIINDDLYFDPEQDISPDAKSLLIGMLEKDPSRRLSLEQVKEHPFFESIDWEKVRKYEISTPWKPYLPPPPRYPKEQCPIKTGLAYDAPDDPCPSFNFVSPKLNEVVAVESPLNATRSKNVNTFFNGIFSVKKKITSRGTNTRGKVLQALSTPIRVFPKFKVPETQTSSFTPSRSSPSPSSKPIIILPTPLVKKDLVADASLLASLTSPPTSPTPFRFPPGLRPFLLAPTPLKGARSPADGQKSPALGSCLLGPISPPNPQLLRSRGIKINTIPSTPSHRTAPLPKSILKARVLVAPPTEADGILSQVVEPEGLHLDKMDVPTALSTYRPPLRPQAISEEECQALFSGLRARMEIETERQSQLRPLLLPGIVSWRSSTAQGDSPSSMGSMGSPPRSAWSLSTCSSSSLESVSLSGSERNDSSVSSFAASGSVAAPPSGVVNGPGGKSISGVISGEDDQVLRRPWASGCRRLGLWVRRVFDLDIDPGARKKRRE